MRPSCGTRTSTTSPCSSAYRCSIARRRARRTPRGSRQPVRRSRSRSRRAARRASLSPSRTTRNRAFGPAFETYGAREGMMMAAECDAHDGLHTSMETMIVEIVVRENGRTRAAKPGETGEVVVTDLHNLAVPLVRYVTGDLAVAHAEERCACGRGLLKIGPIEGRVAETMYDGHGNPVSGLVFSVLFALLGNETRQFQIVQHVDKRITLKVIPADAPALKDATQKALRDWVAKYLPGIPFQIEHVAEIPLTAAGKRKIVVIEK